MDLARGIDQQYLAPCRGNGQVPNRKVSLPDIANVPVPGSVRIKISQCTTLTAKIDFVVCRKYEPTVKFSQIDTRDFSAGRGVHHPDALPAKDREHLARWRKRGERRCDRRLAIVVVAGRSDER